MTCALAFSVHFTQQHKETASIRKTYKTSYSPDDK